MKTSALILTILLGCGPLFGSPLAQDLATLEAQRQAALDTATRDINSKFLPQYSALLMKANTEKALDPMVLARVKFALANVTTVSPEQYAIDAMVNKKWAFEVPRVGFTGDRTFFRDGTWTTEDGKSGGRWKFDHTGLKIFLSGESDRPEFFKFPIKADKWFGIGSNQDVLYLSLTPDIGAKK